MATDIYKIGAVNSDVAAWNIQRQRSSDDVSAKYSTDAGGAAERQAPEAAVVPPATRVQADDGSERHAPNRDDKAKTAWSPSRDKDQVELQFALTQDEKAALSRYLQNRRGDPQSNEALSDEALSEKDRELMEKAAERISKAIDETMASYSESNKRMQKAVSEWYSILAGNDKEAQTNPFEFVRLLRDAAQDKLE